MHLNSKVMQRFEVRLIDPASLEDSHYLKEYKELRDLQREKDGLRKIIDLLESIYAIVIDKKYHKTVGGARLLIKPENSDYRLPFEDETKHKVEILFPDIDRNGVCYAGIDGVVVDESLRNDKIGDILGLELKKRLDTEAERRGAEFCISFVSMRVYFPTLEALRVPDLDPFPDIRKKAGRWRQIIDKEQRFVSIINLPSKKAIQHAMNMDMAMAYTLKPGDHVRDVFREKCQQSDQIALRGHASEIGDSLGNHESNTQDNRPSRGGSKKSRPSRTSPTQVL